MHIAPAVLFMPPPQLEMHFDDSHTSLKMYDIHNVHFFQEIFRGRSDIMQSGNVWKKIKSDPNQILIVRSLFSL